MSDALLEVADLRVVFGSGDAERAAVRGVSLSIDKGETVALVGESGSGKSLTSLAILRLTPPGSHVSSSVVRLEGQDIASMGERALRAVRGRKVSMVFQNPMSSLNPVLTIGRQVKEMLRQHLGLRGEKARQRAEELLQLVEVPDPRRCLRSYPHQLSGGMQQRVMIAIALAADPVLLIADEPTTALDVTLQAQVMRLLGRLQAELGMAMLFISHDLSVVATTAHRVNVMYAGRIVERADVGALFRHPSHPYTRGLLGVVQDLEAESTIDLTPIPGSPPAVGVLPPGCPFAPRCAWVIDKCHVERPELREVGAGQESACHRADEVVRAEQT